MDVPDEADFDIEDLPGWMDRAFPLLFIALGAISCVGIVNEAGDRATGYAVALVAVAVSPWALSLVGIRLIDPVFAAVVIAPVGFLLVFGEAVDIVDLDQGGPQLVMMLLVGIAGQIATVGTNRLMATTTAVAIAVVVAGALSRGDPLDYTPWVVGIVLGVAGGRAFRANVVHLAELRAAHHALAQQAVSEERRRIAREVHDIVAHTLSVTMLHLTAARLAVRRDPAAAEEALAEAERHGRASMDDIRGVVRLLRADESALATALPDDTDLPGLVERYVSAGSVIDLRLDGTLTSLPPAVGLAVYRLVQESLSNASRHGQDPIVVEVERAADAVVVEVTNSLDTSMTTPAEPGAGLTGMRERVAALDGSFAAGPVRDGEAPGTMWRVHARIPV